MLRRVHDLGDHGRVVVRFTDSADGDFSTSSPGVEWRRVALDDRPWSWLDEVHGTDAVVVDAPGHQAGAIADAAVTDRPGVVLAVQMADCAPLAMWSSNGVVAAVHVGWRGLVGGVIESSLDAMSSLGAGDVRAEIGPCLRSARYEFGADDLAAAVARFGSDVIVSTTDQGAPAIDVPAGIRHALSSAGVDDVDDWGICTASTPMFWSWRWDRVRERHSLVVVRELP